MNEVVTGVVSYAIQLYMVKTGNITDGGRMTALVVMNARMLKGFQTVGDMLKANIWGNHFSFLHVALPTSCVDLKTVDPVDFIVKAKDEMRRKRNSLALYFTSRILNVFRKIRGPEVRDLSFFYYSYLCSKVFKKIIKKKMSSIHDFEEKELIFTIFWGVF